jgi:hypothetical protein
MGKIKDIYRRDLVLFQNDARTQYIYFFPNIIKPNRICQYSSFLGLHKQTGMPDQGGLNHFLAPLKKK